MNYLAHMYLSCTEEDMMCGNFLGDLVGNRDLSLIPQEWIQGIRLHRQIDYYTDNHPEVKACTKMIHATQGKYAPVVIDVFFDYLLFLNWETYSGISFEDFEFHIYSTINSNFDKFPGKVQATINRMIRGKFLRSSTSLEGLEFTFSNLKKKMRFKSYVEHAVDDFMRLQDKLDEHFNAFFPDAIAMANAYGNC